MRRLKKLRLGRHSLRLLKQRREDLRKKQRLVTKPKPVPLVSEEMVEKEETKEMDELWRVLQVHDFALTKALDVVAILDIHNDMATCRFSWDHQENEPLITPVNELIKLTHKSGALALKKIGERIGKLNVKRHEIEDCLLYVEEEKEEPKKAKTPKNWSFEEAIMDTLDDRRRSARVKKRNDELLKEFGW